VKCAFNRLVYITSLTALYKIKQITNYDDAVRVVLMMMMIIMMRVVLMVSETYHMTCVTFVARIGIQ